MVTLDTWAEKSKFQYSGSVTAGTTINYGSKYGYTLTVTGEQYKRLRKTFLRKIVDIGTSRNKAPLGSIGNWLQNNVTKTAIASYVGPILIEEGYARKVGKHKIEILK